MVGTRIKDLVDAHVRPYQSSRLADLFERERISPHAIKFVQSKWAASYLNPHPLKISNTPALTWGTATYVTPLAFPLSSALYGRVGLVSEFDPSQWRVFDATDPRARKAYVDWVRVQPALLRKKFREDFRIDCVLFRPDQEAEHYTDSNEHI